MKIGVLEIPVPQGRLISGILLTNAQEKPLAKLKGTVLKLTQVGG